MYSGLGLERKKVTLKTDYELWDKEYLHEKEVLLKNAGRIIRKIEHVGSTSLHIKSKPILDIAVMIESKEDFEILRNLIEKLGYTYRENSGDDERRFFAKGPEEKRTHYLHVHFSDSPSWYKQIFFRNYMRSHEEDRKEYVKLKEKLCSRYPDDRAKYTDGKSEFIKNVLDKFDKTLDGFEILSEKYSIPIEDIILISLNKNGVNAIGLTPRIRMRMALKTHPEEFFYFGLSNNNNSPFVLRDNVIYIEKNIEIGTINNLENDDCASSYFRKQGKVITLNSNKRSTCHGCKFCPNNLELNSEDQNLDTYEKVEVHFRKILGGKDMPDIERLTICTGCFGSEEAALSHILLVNQVAKNLRFNGTLHYIGSEIQSYKAFDAIKKEVQSFMYTFTVECFSKRDVILKKNKSSITLEKYYEMLKKGKMYGFKTNIIYVLGIDNIDIIEKNMQYFSGVMTEMPLINIFQPHIDEHYKLLAESALELEYYLKIRKKMEKIFKKLNKYPQSWECYRPLWYFKYGEDELKCIRI